FLQLVQAVFQGRLLRIATTGRLLDVCVRCSGLLVGVLLIRRLIIGRCGGRGRVLRGACTVASQQVCHLVTGRLPNLCVFRFHAHCVLLLVKLSLAAATRQGEGYRPAPATSLLSCSPRANRLLMVSICQHSLIRSRSSMSGFSRRWRALASFSP